MRKVKLQMQQTIDSYIGGPNGELDWMISDWDEQIKQYVNALTAPVDCILMGRKMTEGFISYWSDVVSDPDNPEYFFAKKMYDTPKVVFTKTPQKSEWHNTDIAKGELADEIDKLKKMPGDDIVVYGGGTFVSSLIRAGLIDEFNLFINSVVLGNGMTITSIKNECAYP